MITFMQKVKEPWNATSIYKMHFYKAAHQTIHNINAGTPRKWVKREQWEKGQRQNFKFYSTLALKFNKKEH